MPELPSRRYFTTQQLAEHWNKPVDEIDHFYSERGLRRAFRLSQEPISIDGTWVTGGEIRVQIHESGRQHIDEWVYIEKLSETARSEGALLIGMKPDYPHPEINGEKTVFVEGPVKRVSIQDFSGNVLSVIRAKNRNPLEIELGFLDLEPVVTIEEVERIEQQTPLEANNSLSKNEREKLQRVIALLAEELSKKTPLFQKSDKPNYQALGDAIAEHLPDGETFPKPSTIRKEISKAYKSLFPD